MCKTQQLLKHIQGIFPNKTLEKYYIVLNNKKIWIKDSEKQRKSIPLTQQPDKSEEAKTFIINNPLAKKIAIMAIDGRGIIANAQTACDAVFFDNSCFCLAEFKYNATSAKCNAIERNIDKGTKQLEKTILKFKIEDIQAIGYKVEAYFGKPPCYPKTNTSLQNKAIKFSNTYKVTLKEENSKTF